MPSTASKLNNLSRTTAKPRYGAASPRLDDIITVALNIIDADGIEGLSMRRLANELGSYPANLYRRFATVDELLALVGVRIFEELGGPPSRDDDPAEALLDFAVRARDGWLAHPRAVSLIFNDKHPATAAVLEDTLAVFAQLGGDDAAYLEGSYEFITLLYGAIFAGAAVSLRAGLATDVPDSSDRPFTTRAMTMLVERTTEAGSHADLTDPQYRRTIQRAIDRASGDEGELARSRRRRRQP